MHAIYTACLGMLRAGGGREGGTEGFMQLLRACGGDHDQQGFPARCAMSEHRKPSARPAQPYERPQLCPGFCPKQALREE